MAIACLSAVHAWAGAGKVEIHQRHMSAAPYVIDQPGQYILTSPLRVSVTNAHAIRVEASNVDIDLNGFTITGPGEGVGLSALVQDSDYENLRVHNGNFTGWGGSQSYAVLAQGVGNILEDLTVGYNGQGLSSGARSRVTGCMVYSNMLVSGAMNGIVVGAGSTVRRCVVRGLAGAGHTHGIRGTSNVMIEDSVVDGLFAPNNAYGIEVGDGATIRRSVVRRIEGQTLAYGIFVGHDSTLVECVGGLVGAGTYASALRAGNRSVIRHGVATESDNGLEVFNESQIVSSLAVTNTQWGMVAGTRSRIEDSYALFNGAVGMLLDGSAGALLDNDAAFNSTGYSVPGAGNLVVGNTAIGNVSNHFNAVASTRLGHIISNPGEWFVVTNRHANFVLFD